MEYVITRDDELRHFGVKGMKWGVRRYQNKDGSLTKAGKRKYDRMSDDKLEKTLRKQIKKIRAEKHGWSNQWITSFDIGKNSGTAIKKFKKAQQQYMSSDKIKKLNKKIEALDRDLDNGKIDPNEYDERYEKIRKEGYDPRFSTTVTYTNNGREYAKEFVNGFGRDITIGYIQDLGYNKQVAEQFADRIIKSKRKSLYL